MKYASELNQRILRDMDDSVLAHPQDLTLAERMERAVYLGLDEKNVTAKYVAGKRIF